MDIDVDIDVNLIIEKLMTEIAQLKFDNVLLELKLSKLIEITNAENDDRVEGEE